MPARAPKRMSPAAMQRAVDKFNANYSIGDVILVHPIAGEPETVERTIISPADILSGHTPVVYVSGGGGCWALSHVAGKKL